MPSGSQMFNVNGETAELGEFSEKEWLKNKLDSTFHFLPSIKIPLYGIKLAAWPNVEKNRVRPGVTPHGA